MYRLILFLILNFSALAIGGLLIGNPGTNEWYQQVNKAPWTPPGWVFGFAWTTIMLCFSFYLFIMDKHLPEEKRLLFYTLFSLQWILNIMWNPVFFRYQMVITGLVIIIVLTILLAWFIVFGFNYSTTAAFLAAPYFIWLLIATSLNAYIYLKN